MRTPTTPTGMAALAVGTLLGCLTMPTVGLGKKLEPGVKTGMAVLVDNPMEVGADRIVNGVAAFHAYGGPCIVLDFGTAITFDVAEGFEHDGLSNAPGQRMSFDLGQSVDPFLLNSMKRQTTDPGRRSRGSGMARGRSNRGRTG